MLPMLGNAEGKVIIPRVSAAGSWREFSLYRLAAAEGLSPRERRSVERSETRPMTGRVSGILDLAAVFRPAAGDDPVTRSACGQQKEETLWVFEGLSHGSGDRKVGESGLIGCVRLACFG